MDMNRRRFFGGVTALASISPAAAKNVRTYRFRTADADVDMTIEFHDGYASRGFWFDEQISNRSYCLSASGEQGRNCMAGFRGSLAIVRYRVQIRSQAQAEPILREHVRTIDHAARLPDRPPFERAILLRKGIGSDLQAFGYESTPEDKPMSNRHGPWYLYRQDMYLDPHSAPFLTVYWKHALTAIRVLDLIPGDQTWLESK